MRRIATVLLSLALSGQTTLADAAEIHVYRHPKPADPVSAACDVSVGDILDGAAPKTFKEADSAVRRQSQACAEARRQAAGGGASGVGQAAGGGQAPGGSAGVPGNLVASLTGLRPGNPTVGDRIDASVQVANANGGVAFAVAAGTLPEGVSFSGSGALTGQFLVAGPFSATLVARDAAGRQAPVTFAGEVAAMAPAVSLHLPAGSPFPGDAFAATASVANGAFPVRWSLESAPAWLALDPASGSVSGTVAAGIADFSFLLRVTDALGRTDAVSSGKVAVSSPTASADLPLSVVQGTSVKGKLSTNLPKPIWSKPAQSADRNGPTLAAWWLAVAPDGTVTGTAPDLDGAVGFDLVAEATSGGRTATARATVQVVPATVSISGFPASGLKGDLVSAKATTNLTGAVTWSLANAPDWLSIDAKGIISGTVAGPVSGLVVRATRDLISLDALPLSMALVTPEVNVTGFPAAVRSGSVATGSLSTTVADGTWSASSLPTGFDVLASGNALTGVAPAVTASQEFQVTVTRKGSQGASASATLPVTVVPALAIASVPEQIGGLIGDPVRLRPVVVAAQGALTFSLRKGVGVNESDAEPDLLACKGISFSRLTGLIDGAPSAECLIEGAFVAVSDDGGSRPTTAATARTAPFVITVGGPALGTPVKDLTFMEGSDVSFPVLTNLHNPTWSFEYGAPAWLRIGADGVVTGTAPDVAKDTPLDLTITVRDGGLSASRGFMLTVKSATVVVEGVDKPVFDGQSLTGRATTNLGDGARFALSGNTAWMSIDAATGSLSGTVSSSNPATSVRVTATRNGASAASNPFSVTPSVPAVTVYGSPFSLASGDALLIQANTNLAKPAWTLRDAPGWMSVDAKGVLTGKAPTVAATTSYSGWVRASSGGMAAEVSFQGTVDPIALSMETMRSRYLRAGQPTYVAAPAVYGSKGALTWRVASGQLPVGMALQADGALSGTPSRWGIYTFSLAVMDSATKREAIGNVVSYDFRDNYAEGVGQLGYSPDIYLIPGDAYSFAPPSVPSDAVGKVTWSLSINTQPRGGAIDPDTGMVSGKTQITNEGSNESHQFSLKDSTGRIWYGNPFDIYFINGSRKADYPNARAFSGQSVLIKPDVRGFRDPVFVGQSGIASSSCSVENLPDGIKFDPVTGALYGMAPYASGFAKAHGCLGVTVHERLDPAITYRAFVDLEVFSSIIGSNIGNPKTLTDDDATTGISIPAGSELVLDLGMPSSVGGMLGYIDYGVIAQLDVSYSLNGSEWISLGRMLGRPGVMYKYQPTSNLQMRYVSFKNTSASSLAIYQLDLSPNW